MQPALAPGNLFACKPESNRQHTTGLVLMSNRHFRLVMERIANSDVPPKARNPLPVDDCAGLWSADMPGVICSKYQTATADAANAADPSMSLLSRDDMP